CSPQAVFTPISHPAGRTRKSPEGLSLRGFQSVKNVPSSRHVRMDGTPTGKLSAESVRAALRRVRGSALNFVPRGQPRQARPVDEAAKARLAQRSGFCKRPPWRAAKTG